MRRGATELSGILPVDKPAGMTSHDVVAAVRRSTGERRVGHAGTLDPMATGLLVVLVGPATRLARYLMQGDKTYEASMAFGTETDTCDAEGRAVRDAPVPPELADEDRAREALGSLLGTYDQVPPAYSAVKVGGRKAYEVARKGGEPALEPRRVEVHEAGLTAVRQAGSTLAWHVRLRVGKGTYVRALARDLGRSLDTAAHLSALRRTASGAIGLEDAHALDAALAAAEEGRIGELFADALAVLALPALPVGPRLAAAVGSGRALPCDGTCPAEDGSPLAIAAEGRLLAVYRRTGGSLVPETVLPGGVR